jgi:hypothetical protein
MRIRTAIYLASATLLLQPWLQVSTDADVFQLRTGGQVQGKMLNEDEYPRTQYVIETESGAQVTLAADQVKHILRRTADQEEYDRLRPTVPDTAQGHWQLAEWCTEHRLIVERQHHLEKVIEHDPNHAEARQLLGYRLEDGQWQTRADIMQSRGYQYYDGEWRTPQDIAIREKKKEREAAELEWKSNLRRWHTALIGSDRGRALEAQEQILSGTDPHAAPALVELLEREKLQPVRKLLVDALAGNPAGAAAGALMERAVRDPDPAIRERAAEALLKRKYPGMVRELAKALKSNDNIEVNRAAIVLGELGYESAISPLIEALVTSHKYQINANQPQIGASFSPGRGGGLSFGGRRPKMVREQLRNHDVLSALVKLSGGQNFDFNDVAWRAWYANTLRVEAVDMRRD